MTSTQTAALVAEIARLTSQKAIDDGLIAHWKNEAFRISAAYDVAEMEIESLNEENGRIALHAKGASDDLNIVTDHRKLALSNAMNLMAEVERLTECLRYEQHRADRRGTHGTDCYKWGPEHYECAMRQVERLTRELAEVKQDAERYRYILDCDVKSALQYLPDLDVDHYKATRRANTDKAMRRTDAGATTG